MLRQTALLLLFAGCSTQTGAPSSGKAASNLTGSSTLSDDAVALVKPIYAFGQRVGTELVCSGVVVGHHTVLTATHCLVGTQPSDLLLNTCDTSNVSCETPITAYNVIQDASHEDHSLVYTSLDVDLPSNFNRAIHPVASSPPDSTLVNTAVTVVGFGRGGLYDTSNTSLGTWNGAKAYQAQTAVVWLGAASVYVTTGPADKHLDTEQAFVTQMPASGARLVRGDSGGPVLQGNVVIATHTAAIDATKTYESPALASDYAGYIDAVELVAGLYLVPNGDPTPSGMWHGEGQALSSDGTANCVNPCPAGTACGDDGQGGQQCMPTGAVAATPDGGNTAVDGGTPVATATTCDPTNNGSDCAASQICVPSSNGTTGLCATACDLDNGNADCAAGQTCTDNGNGVTYCSTQSN